MADLSLGAVPLTMVVNLDPNSDFVTGLDSTDGAWPGTATLTLEFNDPGDTKWTATLNGTAADWNVDKAAVAALISAMPRSNPRVQLLYTDGAADLVWAHGRVAVSR